MSDFKPKFTQDGEEHCESTEAAMVRIMARYNLHRAVCEELIAEVQESFGGGADIARGEFWKMRHVIERSFLVLRSYKNRGGDADMAERCVWLMLGFPTLAGAESLAELIKRLGINKATVNKCLQHFQKQIPELPILEGQRNEQSRDRMKKSRINQIIK